MSWETVSIGDICDVKGGKRLPKGHDYSPEPTPYRYIRVADINDSKIDAASLNYLYPETHKKISKYIVNTGDVIISIAGTIGVTVPVINELDGINLTENAAKLVPKEKDIYDPYYLSLVFQSPFVQHQISGLTGQVTIGKLALFRIKEIEIPLPPLGEQRRIAAVLDKADALRQKRRAALAKLDTLLQATFLHMFGDPVTNPMGWEKRPLGYLTKIRRGASPRPISKFIGGTVPWIKIGDATHGSNIYIYDTAEKVTEEGAEKSVFLEPGALIVANSGVSLGFARILKISGCVHDGWLALEDIHESINKIFLLKLINHLTHYFRQMAPSGTQPNLNTTIMKEFEVIVPPIKMQEMFENSVNQIEKQIRLITQSENELDNLFHALQQRAFSGQL